MKAEGSVGVIYSCIIGQPHHLAHIKREIPSVIDWVAPTQFGGRSIGWVCKHAKMMEWFSIVAARDRLITQIL